MDGGFYVIIVSRIPIVICKSMDVIVLPRDFDSVIWDCLFDFKLTVEILQ